MHPIASHQIATVKAAELRRQADRYNAHAPARLRGARHGAPSPLRSSLRRAWGVVTRAPRTA